MANAAAFCTAERAVHGANHASQTPRAADAHRTVKGDRRWRLLLRVSEVSSHSLAAPMEQDEGGACLLLLVSSLCTKQRPGATFTLNDRCGVTVEPRVTYGSIARLANSCLKMDNGMRLCTGTGQLTGGVRPASGKMSRSSLVRERRALTKLRVDDISHCMPATMRMPSEQRSHTRRTSSYSSSSSSSLSSSSSSTT